MMYSIFEPSTQYAHGPNDADLPPGPSRAQLALTMNAITLEKMTTHATEKDAAALREALLSVTITSSSLIFGIGPTRPTHAGAPVPSAQMLEFQEPQSSSHQTTSIFNNTYPPDSRPAAQPTTNSSPQLYPIHRGAGQRTSCSSSRRCCTSRGTSFPRPWAWRRCGSDSCDRSPRSR